MKAWEPGSQCRFQSRSEGPEPETPRARLTAQRNSQTETMNPPFLHSLLYPGLNRVIDVLPRCGGQSVLPHTCGYAQSCLTLCVSLDCSPPGCSVRGVFQARILECAAIYSSRWFPPPEDLPDPRMETTSPPLQADSSLLSHQGRLCHLICQPKC